MNFSLTPNLEQFVRETLRLFKGPEERRALKLERLRAEIRAGDDAIARGEYTELNTDEELDAFFVEL